MAEVLRKEGWRLKDEVVLLPCTFLFSSVWSWFS
jgi:hypothetical protein